MNIYRTCAELLESGASLVMVTVLKASEGSPGKPGFKLLYAQDGRLFGTVGGGALELRAVEEAGRVLETRTNLILTLNLAQLGMVCGGEVSLVFEYLPAQKGFFLFGGGHVGRALVPILESLGFLVTVFDNREEIKAQLEEDPQRRLVIGDYGDISPVLEQAAASGFCFIATHGHEHDYAVLRQLLAYSNRYRYIGLIGSKIKVKNTLERLRAEGMAAPGCLFAPVGIRLGGSTAAEIAVSVAAEVVALRHGVKADHLRLSEPEAGLEV